MSGKSRGSAPGLPRGEAGGGGALGGATMTDLLLQPAPASGPNDYEVIADDWIVGRIVLSDASPAERPWMWSLDHEFYQGRDQTHGYEATREAAMQAFAKCWHHETY